MAEQVFLSNNPLTNRQWSLGVEAEVLKKISFNAFMGRRSDALIQVKDELQKYAGDTVTYGLRLQLAEATAAPTGTDVLTGNEKTLTFQDDALVIDIMKDAIAWDTHMSRQRINFEMLDEAKNAIADYLSSQIDVSLFNQLAGVSDETDLSQTGMQATISEPDTAHHLFATNSLAIEHPSTYPYTARSHYDGILPIGHPLPVAPMALSQRAYHLQQYN